MDKYGFWIVIILVSAVGAQTNRTNLNVAVLPFSGDQTVTTQQLEFITANFSGELIATNGFTVLDRGTMEFILQEQGFQQTGACNSSECKVQMGQLLGVDNLVAGKLVRFGTVYALHLEFIDVGTGEIVNTVNLEEKGLLEDVYKPLCYKSAVKLHNAVNNSPRLQPDSQQLLHNSVTNATNHTLPEVSNTAIPSLQPKTMSAKRKIALALWGIAIGGIAGGYYFNTKGDEYAEDYERGISSQDIVLTKDSYKKTHDAEDSRNISYGVGISGLVIGSILWFWPEGK